MLDITANNIRILKNTLLLYARMLIMICVTLYTSRVVISALGIVDYGIFNVVGGLVVIFGFVNSSMASATSRYLTFALGKNDSAQLKTVFDNSLIIHRVIAALVFVFGEIIGVWFLYDQMHIPPERLNAAFWVLQCSLISTAIVIMSVPYNADIIAHEKMSVFAAVSVTEVLLKLLAVCLLSFFKSDKLILYSIFLLLIQVAIRVLYGIYTHRCFVETRGRRVRNKKLQIEILKFASWSLFGNFSLVMYTQGLNILLNVFCGTAVNAARAIAVQVQGAVNQFIGNFQMALNPQITKYYAINEYAAMRSLASNSARFSFFLFMLMAIPIQVEAPYLLSLWLGNGNVPENTVVFVRIILLIGLVTTLSNPLIVMAQASGNIRKFQVITGTISLLILPVSYICLKSGSPAYSVFIVHLSVETVDLFVRVCLLRKLIDISLKEYFRNVVLRIFPVFILSYPLPILVHDIMDSSIGSFLTVCMISLLSSCLLIYCIGMNSIEKRMIIAKCKFIYGNIIKH